MPFNSLLLVSLIPDTSFSESSVIVSMTQAAGEKVLFFKMDQPVVRTSLGMINGPICDGLVFYFRENERTCCFVELKGGHVDKAVDQIITTYNHFKAEIQASLIRMGCQPLLKQVSWKAYIGLNINAPVKESAKSRLNAVFGKDNCSIERHKDLGLFLRKGNKNTKKRK